MKALHYKKTFGAAVLSGMLSLTLASTVLAASEFTGTLSNHVSQSSTSNGSLGGTVGSGGSGSISGTVTGGSSGGSSIASNSDGSGGGGTISGSRRHSVVTTSSSANPNDVIIILDDGSAVPASSDTFANSGGSTAGTGGGYDPSLEATLAGLDDADGQISPEDAIAFNTADNPLLNSDFTAATGDSGISSGKTVAAIILGLALLGLAGYAVNSLLAYRRENDL